MVGIAIALGVIAVALIAIAILLIILLVKKKPAPAPETKTETQPTPAAEPPKQETAFAGEYTIQLSDIRRPGQKWKLSVTGEVLIGRETDCDLVLADARVSRHHCRISVGQDGLFVANLSEINETKHNGLRISGSNTLNAGDILKIGHDELRVDFIQSFGDFSSYESASQSAQASHEKRPTSDDTKHFF